MVLILQWKDDQWYSCIWPCRFTMPAIPNGSLSTTITLSEHIPGFTTHPLQNLALVRISFYASSHYIYFAYSVVTKFSGKWIQTASLEMADMEIRSGLDRAHRAEISTFGILWNSKLKLAPVSTSGEQFRTPGQAWSHNLGPITYPRKGGLRKYITFSCKRPIQKIFRDEPCGVG